MANYRSEEQTRRIRYAVLHTAAKLFLDQGYVHTSIQEIAGMAKVSKSTLMYVFKSKEEILAELVAYVLEGQFTTTERLLKGITDDPILFYAAETTMQLHMAESSEHIRDLYNAAYSMPKTMDIIQHAITGKLEHIFKEHLPHLDTKDFYELEIASGGIMRSFMARPCDMYFTMERKVARFLETTFLVYRVSDQKIAETIQFVNRFDFNTIARQTIKQMLEYLEKQLE